MSVEGSSVRCLRTRVEQVCEGVSNVWMPAEESEVVKCVVCVAKEYRKFSSKATVYIHPSSHAFESRTIRSQ